LGFLLLATSAVGRRAAVPLCLLALLACPASTTATSSEPSGEGTVIYQRDTNYHRIIVVDDGTWRTLRFNHSAQSSMLKKDAYRGGYRYTDGFHLDRRIPEAKSALFIGCGAATVPKQFRKFYPRSRSTWWRSIRWWSKSRRSICLPTGCEDARRGAGWARVSRGDQAQLRPDLYGRLLRRCRAVPLTTVEFMRIIKSHLTPNGVAVFNIISAMEGSDSKLARSEYRTIHKVFPNCAVFPIIDADEKPQQYSKSRVRNVIMVATDRPALGPQEISQRVARLKNARLPYLETIAASYHTAELPTRTCPS